MQIIPKIIHFCWFGRQQKNQMLAECMKSWKEKLPEYRFCQWDESNCDLKENKFVEQNYKEKNYAFVSDYFRLKALYEYGGIYLDTDVWVKHSMNDLLHYSLFMGFIYNHLIGTAVIGCSRHNKIIKQLLGQYSKEINGKIVNNDLVTQKFQEIFPYFCRNGKKQELEDGVIIFSKGQFENGFWLRAGHTVHLCDGSWHTINNINKEKKTV